MKTLELEVPSGWFNRLKKTLAGLKIPESEISRLLASRFAIDSMADDAGWWFGDDGYIYPDRETAKRAAESFFARFDGQEMETVSYYRRRRIIRETMLNPRYTEWLAKHGLLERS